MKSGLLPIRFVLFGWLWLLSIGAIQAQDRCSIVRYEAWLDRTRPGRESSQVFEKWISGKIKEQRLQGIQTVITIPVVVHIIHNGEAVGVGTNLSEAQINSQIAVINKDFNRTNTDAAQTPAEFQPFAGQLEIEFVLAKRSPDGLPTNGINRINGGRSSWSLTEENTFKALSYWPAEDYLNLWVLNLSGGDIGYASFPVSNLPGLSGQGTTNRLTDGVIVDYITFGSVDDGSFNLDNRFNKGRTATHELGHFFGLRHIWGDGSNCQASDFVDDTPSQSSETTGCPAHPQVSCTVPKMFQNYMDYTNDGCMNIFTAGQISRMQTILANSPRRLSLTTSLGSIPPGYAVDASIKLIQPTTSPCPGSLVPAVEVQSIGTDPVSTVKIALEATGFPTEIKSFSLVLNQGQKSTVYFSQVTLTAGAAVVFNATLLEVNGASDELASNNLAQVVTDVPNETALPFLETFEELSTDWTIVNPDQSFGWSLSDAGDGSMTVRAYDYDETGDQDALISPVFNTSETELLLLQFDLAYARYPGNDEEQLSVYVVDDCSTSISGGAIIFDKKGSALATSGDTFHPFVPTVQDWRRESIPLNAFVNRPNLRIVFVFKGNYGNNIYLDRIRMTTGPVVNLSLVELTEPSPVSCSESIIPKILIRNLGSVDIQSIQVSRQLNDVNLADAAITLNIPAGGAAVATLPQVTLQDEANVLRISVVADAGEDEDLLDNSMESTIVHTTMEDRVPARYRFESGLPWITASGAVPWRTESTDQGTSMVFPGYGETGTTSRGWLVSPVLDFSRLVSAGLFADISYATGGDTPEHLQVLASLDCGATFSEVLLDAEASDLSGNESNTAWTPTADSDWSRTFVNLTTLAGQENVLLAFVARLAGNNNLFLDNIELFTTDDPDPEVIDELFRIYTDETSLDERITFNLPERSTVRLQILTSTGLPILDNTYQDILNQTLTYRLNRPTGIYIYRLFINGQTYAVRHFVP